MRNSIEIQILSTLTRQQLIQLRDELRLLEVLEGIELQIPGLPHRQGIMGFEAEVVMGIIAGITHFTSEKGFEFLVERITTSISKIKLKKEGRQPLADHKSKEAEKDKDWEIIISTINNGSQNRLYLDSEGTRTKINNQPYSLDPNKTYALLAGISQYDDSTAFISIKPVEKNLEDVYRVLCDKRLIGLPITNIQCLYNESAVNIQKSLSYLSKQENIETIIFYFTGHGQNNGKNQLSLIARDTHCIDEELHNDIAFSFIDQKMKGAKASQKIIIIDACNSGLATQGNDNFSFESIEGTFTLTSTSADENSYFKQDNGNTYFTYYLLEALNKGIPDIKPLKSKISLADLYNYTKQKLVQLKLPAPTCKSQLTNISPEQFYISNNLSFSLDAKLKEIEYIIDEGNYETARKEYQLLRYEYSDESKIDKAYSNFETLVRFIELVGEAENLFYKEKNYNDAKQKYEEALFFRKEDLNIKNKIQECKRLEKTRNQIIQSEPEIIKPPSQSATKTWKGKLISLFLFSMLIIVLYIFREKFIPQEHKNKVTHSDTSQKFSSPQPNPTITIAQAENLINRIPFKLKAGEGLPIEDSKTFDSLLLIIKTYPVYKIKLVGYYTQKADTLKKRNSVVSEQYKNAAQRLDFADGK